MASSSSSSPGSSSSLPEMGEANETRNWVALPRDVTAIILQKVGAIDILENVQKVCLTWRNICKDPAMWRSIDMFNLRDLGDVPCDLEKMCRHAVDLSCGQLVDINIGCFGTNDLLQYIAERTSRLRRLQLACCHRISDEGLSEAAKKLPLLEDLHIYYISLSKESLETVGRCCPQLKSLKFNMHLSRAPHMESDEEAIAIAETMPGLRNLQLIGNQMTNDGLKAILDGCPHLESLDLRQSFNIHLAGALGRRCSERIKDLRCPHDSSDDYGFDASIHDAYGYAYGYGCDSLDDESPSGFSENDLLSDVDDYYEFSAGSDFADDEPFFDD